MQRGPGTWAPLHVRRTDRQREPARKYRVEVGGDEPDESLRDLVRLVDQIAEIPNSFRQGTEVRLAESPITPQRMTRQMRLARHQRASMVRPLGCTRNARSCWVVMLDPTRLNVDRIGRLMTDERADLALSLAQQAAEASERFKTKSPVTAELAALTSTALSLSQIAALYLHHPYDRGRSADDARPQDGLTTACNLAVSGGVVQV